MKRIVIICIACLFALTTQAQKAKPDLTNTKTSTQEQRLSPAETGYVNLGLPSGTLWKEKNENEFYSYEEAIQKFKNQLPTKAQWEELRKHCQWKWMGNGYRVTGPNGNSITLPAMGYVNMLEDTVDGEGEFGYYSTSTKLNQYAASGLYFENNRIEFTEIDVEQPQSVRLVTK